MNKAKIIILSLFCLFSCEKGNSQEVLNGISTKRTEVLGNFRPGGFSSTLSFFDRLISFLTWKISLRVEDESALIDELRVDIAADIIPAISIPLTPIGKNVAMKSGSSRSLRTAPSII